MQITGELFLLFWWKETLIFLGMSFSTLSIKIGVFKFFFTSNLKYMDFANSAIAVDLKLNLQEIYFA